VWRSILRSFPWLWEAILKVLKFSIFRWRRRWTHWRRALQHGRFNMAVRVSSISSMLYCSCLLHSFRSALLPSPDAKDISIDRMMLQLCRRCLPLICFVFFMSRTLTRKGQICSYSHIWMQSSFCGNTPPSLITLLSIGNTRMCLMQPHRASFEGWVLSLCPIWCCLSPWFLQESTILCLRLLPTRNSGDVLRRRFYSGNGFWLHVYANLIM